MKSSKPIIPFVTIVQIQNVEYSGKWWCMALGNNGKSYMASCDLKTEEWSDWTEVPNPKK